MTTPRPAYAESPNCNGKSPGHYSGVENVTGNPSSQCGAPPGPIGQCTIGHIYFEWDCVENPDGSGVRQITNANRSTPQGTVLSVSPL